MDRDEFWSLIDSAADDPSVMKARLKAMSEAELVDFYATFRGRAEVFLDERYWEHFDRPVSEDDHDDVAEYIVRKGYRYWKQIAYNPEHFPATLPADDDGISYASMANEEYWERYGQDIREPDEPPPPNAS